MKAVRTHDYRIDGYGNVTFIKVDLGSGHSSYKVFWRRVGAKEGTRIAWIQEVRKPSAKLALFFCQMACSLEDGHDRHHYYDKGLKPPQRIQTGDSLAFPTSSIPPLLLLDAWPPVQAEKDRCPLFPQLVTHQPPKFD
jgi:hypothetical protein